MHSNYQPNTSFTLKPLNLKIIKQHQSPAKQTTIPNTQTNYKTNTHQNNTPKLTNKTTLLSSNHQQSIPNKLSLPQ